ncbi:hypothetical protein BGZ73_003688 [Actinomortierella ambigua]|nr:hypothetical protein BGZ73_003688 [Actinomortierella ambigua]
MSDSRFCHAHWRDADLLHAEFEPDLGTLPDDAVFEQQLKEQELKWTDLDLPRAPNPAQNVTNEPTA